jgi:hypothetical protein
MAEQIKAIARANKQAVAVAIKTALKGDRKRIFEDMLNEVAEVLTSPEKKKRTDEPCEIPSDDKLFENDILPQIVTGINTYLNQQNRSIDLQWNVDFGFIDLIHEGKLNTMEIIKFTHDKILVAEQKITSILLLTAYARGMSYLAARPFVSGEIKEWYKKEFNTSFRTVCRYQQVTMLLMTYPGLLVTGLSFMQCLKHHNRIIEHLIKNKELSSRLRTIVMLSVEGNAIEIAPANVKSIPRALGQLNTDPDYMYEKDTSYKEIAVDKKTDEHINCYVKDAAEKRQENEMREKAKNLAVQDYFPPLTIHCSGTLCRK